MSLRILGISRFLPLEFTSFMRICESEKIHRAVILRLRAEIMAVHITKIYVIKGDATKGKVAEWEVVAPASSMTQP